MTRDNEHTQSTVAQEPVAWVRRHPDGALTAEFLEHAVIETARKRSGAWVPLYAAPVAAQAQQQAIGPGAAPRNGEILDLAISEGMAEKDGVYCGSAATILCFAGALTRSTKPAQAQQPASGADVSLLKAARHRIANLSRAAVPFDDPLDGPVLTEEKIIEIARALRWQTQYAEVKENAIELARAIERAAIEAYQRKCHDLIRIDTVLPNGIPDCEYITHDAARRLLSNAGDLRRRWIELRQIVITAPEEI
ncbi:MAG: hypothetical protein ABN482_00565 [Corticimicrobacter sp.]|uniref:hypothetical protein n=1 Tax=Corticimicrobacter sp. TaxID=2678536 RepID=UPI0032DB6E08